MSCSIRVYGHNQYVSVICTCRECGEGRPCLRRDQPGKPPLPCAPPPPMPLTSTPSSRSLPEGCEARGAGGVWRRSSINTLDFSLDSSVDSSSSSLLDRSGSCFSAASHDSRPSRASSDPEHSFAPAHWALPQDAHRGSQSSSATLEHREAVPGEEDPAWRGRGSASSSLPPSWQQQQQQKQQGEDSSLSRKIQAAFSYRLQDAYNRAMTERFPESR